jgi:hypothetical protein
MAPQDGEDLSFIPGGDRFAGLLRNRQYRGRGHDSPSLIDREKDRVYKVKSFDFQEKNQVALPNYVADREAKNVKLPQQSDAMDKVLKCPAPVAPPPPYEELPNNLNTFSPGKSVYIVSNARGVPPELSIEHKFEPPNNIHLRIKIQNCGYWVSQLAFKIKFCNGAVILLQSLRTDN